MSYLISKSAMINGNNFSWIKYVHHISKWDRDEILYCSLLPLLGWLVCLLATQCEVLWEWNESRYTIQSLCSAHIPLYFIILAILNLMIFYGYALWSGHVFPYYLFPKKNDSYQLKAPLENKVVLVFMRLFAVSKQLIKLYSSNYPELFVCNSTLDEALYFYITFRLCAI